MTGKHIDHRMNLAARRLALLAAALALAGVLNVSGCSNQTATTARADSGRWAIASVPVRAAAETSSARLATTAIRQLSPTLSRIPVDDVSERFDHLPTGIPS